jgi:hypothetical protein
MEIFDIAFILLGVGMAAKFVSWVLEPSPLKHNDCKVHKWEYRGEKPNQYMVCSVCKLLPGLSSTEESDL